MGTSFASSHNDRLRSGIRFYYALHFFRCFTFVWLYWNVAKYGQLLERPLSIFSPDQMMAWALVPEFPEPWVFYLVAGSAAVCNGWQLFFKKSIGVQAVVAAGLLWMNLVPWSYGAQSHVNHLFLLAHLFLVFVPVQRAATKVPSVYQAKSIDWFYKGLLFTYTLAGLWKVPALAYKVVTQSADVHWIKPKAALFNARVSFLEYDLPLTFESIFTSYSWAWQAGFVVVVYLQVSAFFSARRLPLRPWLGAAFIGFHLVNQVAFLIFFVVACFTLLFLFFPYECVTPHYHKLKKIPLGFTFTGRRLQAVYARTYPDGELDQYMGFEAYRQRWLDKNYLLYGCLYLPGVKTAVELIWRFLGQPEKGNG